MNTQSPLLSKFSTQGNLQLVQTLRERGISDENVLYAIEKLPRDKFVPSALKSRAYEDSALPISCSQTISQPYTVARMTELANVQQGAKVLEIGTGSGYQAAVLALLGARVFSIERHYDLHRSAEKTLQELHLNVALKCGDGTIGWTEFAPYDVILVTAAAPDVPEPLAQQLAIGGRLIIPVGDKDTQTMYIVTKIAPEKYNVREAGNFAFVPLIGRAGWNL